MTKKLWMFSNQYGKRRCAICRHCHRSAPQYNAGDFYCSLMRAEGVSCGIKVEPKASCIRFELKEGGRL
jgi:hypothetical protein